MVLFQFRSDFDAGFEAMNELAMVSIKGYFTGKKVCW